MAKQAEEVKLVAGVKWPEVVMPGDTVVQGNDIEWVPMEGFPGIYVKVLYADRATNMIAMLGKIDPYGTFPMHEHRCRAFAFTVRGHWWYGDRKMYENTLAFEDIGSTHFPETAETGFEVLTIIVGEPGEPLLRVQDPETLDVFELTIDYFIDLMNSQKTKQPG